MTYRIPLKKLLLPLLTVLLGGFAAPVTVALISLLRGGQYTGVDDFSLKLLASVVDWLVVYVPGHWDRLLWAVAAAFTIWVVIFSGLPFLARAWKRRILLQKVGIRGYLPRETEADRSESWNDCIHFLQHPGNDSICILGANGWETFGKPKSPLFNVLKSFRGPVRILLVHPYSKSLSARAASLKQVEERYRRDIFRSINFARSLKRAGKDVELRVFNWPPVWKMIFSTDRLWLQHYHDAVHVDETPVYSFGRNPESSLYHPFRKEFQRIWDQSMIVHLHLTEEHIKKLLFVRV